MTREQRNRLRASWVPEKARRYVALMDRFNGTDTSVGLRTLTRRSEELLREMEDDEYAVAHHLLHTMEREDTLRRRP